MEELAAILGEELALPRIEPRGKKNITTTPRSLHRHSPGRARIAAPFQAHLQAGPEAADRLADLQPGSARSSCPSGQDKQYRSWKEVHQPQSVAVIIYMMDVSGSMTDEQKEIVRIEAFWIDTWIKAHYQGIETVYIIHDAAAQEVDEHTFYHTRESGGTKISSAYELADKIIQARYPPDQWNIYAFHFSDGDNWGDDIPHCMEILTEEAAAQGQPVRLRPGGKPLRQRRVLRVHSRAGGRPRERRGQPHPRPRRHSGIDQGVPGDGT